MTKVYCFSGSGHSMEIAQYIADALGQQVRQICGSQTECAADTAVVVFPVYCQNIPKPVKDFLPRISAKHVVLIATYGRISHGNVLHEASRLVSGTVIAAAYVPTAHTYLQEQFAMDKTALDPLLQRIGRPKRAVIPRSPKHLLADLMPGIRSRAGVRICKTAYCSSCGLCDSICPMQTMRCGVAGKHCIRCLRCVKSCPNHALTAEYNPFLKLYLKKKRRDKLVIYL